MAAAAAAASPFRDRTSEFLSLSKTLRRIGGNVVTPQHSQSNDPVAVTLDRSEFNKKASRIGLRIHQTSQKIDRLSNLTKRSSIFDDRSKENEELTVLIKNDITTLNMAITDLQTLQTMEIGDGNYSGDRVVHLTAVCDDLKNRLMNVTKQFQDVFTTRTKNIKAHENRKQIFSCQRSSLLGNFVGGLSPCLGGGTRSSRYSTGGSQQPSVSIGNGVQVGSQLRRRMGTDANPSPQMEASMLQQVVPRQESISQSRTVALQNVESTISELSGIFTHLATMVAQQGELAIRIDDNMDESLANVEGASNALLKYLNKISSNRWLMIKIFLVLILFLVIFIVFLL
ncbi:SNARE protein SED5/Syntaxin 5 [Handroanthus impetiginosus]|uniref:SNARE protein SED5/Syntaxin 5 n=1 Tax=Handroanthus impetiginosus TaxID=429701 RepID=A0A2G9HTK9_9LAMI|nr:SNARE protein SED5/Syntaxin 5 [Handroanthus impetiginosus]